MFKNLLAIIFLGAGVAVFFTLSKPLYNEIQIINTKKDSLNKILSQLEGAVKKRDQLLSVYNSISENDLGRLEKMVPPVPQSIKYILELDNISNRNGILLKSVSVSDSNEKSNSLSPNNFQEAIFKETPVSLKVTAPYKAFYSFLKDLQNNLRLTDIREISFVSGEKDFYEFNINSVIYSKWDRKNILSRNTITSEILSPEAQEVVSIFNTLNEISLDADFFNGKNFTSLTDFSVQLPLIQPGKANPFSSQ